MSHQASSQQTTPPADIFIPDLPHGSYKVYATALARYYHAQPGPKSPHWEYSRYRGMLVFGKTFAAGSGTCQPGTDSQDDSALIEGYWFKLLVSKSSETKTVWSFKLLNDLNYQVDKPFFHVVHGLTRRYGFLFEDDDAASIFAEQVRANYIPSAYGKPSLKRGNSFRSKSSPSIFSFSKRHTPITISAPLVDSFHHVMHIGLNNAGVFETRGLKPAWEAALNSLQNPMLGAQPVESPETLASEAGGK